MSDIVVGDEGCDIDDVVETLAQSKSTNGLMRNWKAIARNLGLSSAKLSELNEKEDEETMYEIWILILDAWVDTKGDDAKISVLIEILKNARYATRDAADKLQRKYNIQSSGPPSRPQQPTVPAYVTQQIPNAGLIPGCKSREEAHINKYLPLLISRTQVNVSLTSTLISLGVFGDDDIHALDAIPAANVKASEFYRIIKTKDNFYPHLITALEAGNQSGAVAILRSICL